MIKIVVVDDSAFMRKAIQLMLETDPEMKVVGLARDGQEGVDMVKEFKPDVVTLDLEMPRMNGLEAIDIIMRDIPTPILVVSSISTESAPVTLEALDKGAMDYIAKSQSFVAIDIITIKMELLAKVRSIGRRSPAHKKSALAAIKRRNDRKAALGDPETTPMPNIGRKIIMKNYELVTIGVSTGGPPVVQHILDNLPADFPAGVLIAQHMPSTFTKPFADRLNKTSPLQVKEAEIGDEITKGTVLIGRGGKHLVAKWVGSKLIAALPDQPDNLLYFPSADVLFSSAVNALGENLLGVILTGMGHDGVKGLRELHDANGTIVAQNEESCVVYGMPKAAVDAGLADLVTTAHNMPEVITKLVK